VGHGSEFTVRLPILPEHDEERHDENAGKTGARGRALSILVVDDNVDEAQSLSMLLKMCGHQTRTATNGPAALEAARLHQPEVVLLNLGLPSLGGCEVARQLLGVVERRPLLIAVTGYGHEESCRRAAEAGFDHYLVKPVELEKLHQLLLQVS
jgi:CheY-like chemotaxis protein